MFLAGGCSATPASFIFDQTVTPKPEISDIKRTPTETIKPVILPTSQVSLVPQQTSIADFNTKDIYQDTINACHEIVCYETFSGIFSIPIPKNGIQIIEPTYRYGTTQLGEKIPHVGVEFYNPSGTTVLASTDGIVIFAGSDESVVWGEYPGFYGNLIVIKHEIPNFSEPIFTLYAHLSQIDVQTEQLVSEGQQIGLVGASGSAIGSHLHFEVRIGEPLQENIRNPELFLKLRTEDVQHKFGILIGNVTFKNQPVSSSNVVLQKIVDETLNTDSSLFLETYAQNIPSDSNYQENFTISNLPAGRYRISTFIEGKLIETVFMIKDQTLTIIHLDSEE